ncbi:multiubiquitin domain-containing protein [Azohydromonas lata]|uniref:Multiubiquitin domain-containing protein n=1 Tax=Azohydromonas lata TaxID=45677 RepID=A0ABU5I894_9BURK|nr:multiubiquitin domain-containing protein [Azohydromonas lata]MDZ5455312.1 multiubiquitin domain-containing protein [Azohydromonas lata]
MNAHQASSSLNQPASQEAAGQLHHEAGVIASEQCILQLVLLHVPNPTGADILKSAGRPANAEQLVLQVLHKGGLESINLDEHADLAAGNKFVLADGDLTYRFTVNGKQYEWPYRLISGAMLAELANVPADLDIELHQGDKVVPVGVATLINLSDAGVEKFISIPKKHTWKLMLQGVVREYDTPLVKVADAMQQAGFDPKKAWHIYLIVQGQPKQEIGVDSIVDLRTQGIEKIRLMQRNVDNGDGQQYATRRMFQLLPQDVEYLDGLVLRWETVMEGGRRWLLIHDFLLPTGFAQQKVLLGLDVPQDYPASQIDMFYFFPFVTMAGGQEIPSTQIRATVDGITLQGWSRHRNAASVWDPNSDSIRTHMAVVEGSLAKELGE